MAKECKWILKEPADPGKVTRLATEVGIDRVLAELPLVAEAAVERVDWGDLFVRILKRVAMAG